MSKSRLLLEFQFQERIMSQNYTQLNVELMQKIRLMILDLLQVELLRYTHQEVMEFV